jgi:SAM-dependent methyltransferase
VRGGVLAFEGPDPGGYRAFEDLFRGDEAMIRERQRRAYVPLLEDAAPVFDAGCGRGEMLEVLRDAGIDAQGVDLDAELVDHCRAKGLDAEVGDAIASLERRAEGSLGAVFSAQVVEHLPEDVLRRFVAAAHRALRPGGRLIMETVNPHSPRALKAFWVDPTHEHPLFPEVLLQMARASGFASGYAFCPNGEGDWERDRRAQGEYAVVATR